MIGTTLGNYRIDDTLGEGGMGVVYRALDLRLQRPVALKRIRSDATDPTRRERFWREARIAAAFNHPNIGHLYEIGEESGELFIAMELLEGETLAQRLARGALPLAETVRVGLEVVSALAAFHARGFVHRDVKPSNVFLLGDGRVKLLDFGLATASAAPRDPATETRTGVVMGSPHYMAPEQVRGEPIDGRTDLFSLAVVLHEAVTGRPVFAGDSPVEVMYAVLNQRAPSLGGDSAAEALGTFLDRALAKRPEDRPVDAAAFAESLRAVPIDRDADPSARPTTRVVRLAVLPFRLLSPDPDKDLLRASLADAVSTSLSGIRSLVVRSTLASSRFDGASLDLREAAAALDVDALLVGTILPSGPRCRVTAQLVETPAGRVLWSQHFDVDGGADAFTAQDAITRRIVEALQLPLSARERGSLSRDVPANAQAYELYLRANRMGVVANQGAVARELYLASLEADPHFAPAWARLGRCYRTAGKYDPIGRDENYRRAESALKRALELHPDLPSAHHFLAQLELDDGRVTEAVDRLLVVVEESPNDANGWVGLVSAFRYLGLLEESQAAHARARAIDPEVSTSIHYTLASLGLSDALEHERFPDSVAAMEGWVLARAGREAEAITRLARAESADRGSLAGTIARLYLAALQGDQASTLAASRALEGFPDPEGAYLHGGALARAGCHDRAIETLEIGMDAGYVNVPLFARDPWLDPVRGDPRLRAAIARAEVRHRAARAAYGGKVLRSPTRAV